MQYCKSLRITDVKKQTHIAAVEGQLQEVGRTVSHHVLERVIVQAEVLQEGKEHGETDRFGYMNVKQEIGIYDSRSGIKTEMDRASSDV